MEYALLIIRKANRKLHSERQEMTPQQETILNTVRTNGGSVDWHTLIEAVEYQDRQRALSDVRVLEKDGHLKRIVAKNPLTGKVELSINVVTA